MNTFEQARIARRKEAVKAGVVKGQTAKKAVPAVAKRIPRVAKTVAKPMVKSTSKSLTSKSLTSKAVSKTVVKKVLKKRIK